VTFVAEIGDVRRFETPRPADGLCRSGALGALGRTRPTRQHYQSRQPKSPPCPHRGGLDVSLSGSPEPASASSTGEPPQVVRAIEVRLIQDCRRRQTLVLAALRSKELAAPARTASETCVWSVRFPQGFLDALLSTRSAHAWLTFRASDLIEGHSRPTPVSGHNRGYDGSESEAWNEESREKDGPKKGLKP